MKDRVKQLMSKVFDIDVEAIGDDASPQSVPNWDSLLHLVFIDALEEEFEIEFDEDQFVELDTLEKICTALE